MKENKCTKCKKECEKNAFIEFLYDGGRFHVIGYNVFDYINGYTRPVFHKKCYKKILKFAGLK